MLSITHNVSIDISEHLHRFELKHATCQQSRPEVKTAGSSHVSDEKKEQRCDAAAACVDSLTLARSHPAAAQCDSSVFTGGHSELLRGSLRLKTNTQLG